MVNKFALNVLAQHRADKRYPVSHVYYGPKAIQYAKLILRGYTSADPDYWDYWTDKQKREAVSFVVMIKRKNYTKYTFKLVIGDSVMGQILKSRDVSG